MPVFVVMGVSGSGKSTVASSIAEHFQLPFAEADDYHTDSNKDKMNRGVALTDDDRLPWLQALHRVIAYWISEGVSAVVTCSALKRKYRNILLTGCTESPTSSVYDAVVFLFLSAEKSTLLSRLSSRENHFFPSTLLDNQLSVMETPNPDEECCVVVDGNAEMDVVLQQVFDIVSLRL